MKKVFLLASFICWAIVSSGQSKTTQALQDKYEGSLSFYFYKNTLRMLNQKEDKDFDDMIRDIEKLKVLMIDKGSTGFLSKDYKKLISDYKTESYETAVTSRFEGRNLDLYINDKGSTPCTVVLVNDSSRLFVLDMIGTIDVSKAGALFSAFSGNSDVAERIKDFTSHDGKKRRGVKID